MARLEAARRNAQESTKTELAGLALELAKLEKAHREARRVLALATPTADRDGVVTWTLTEEIDRQEGRGRGAPRRPERLPRRRVRVGRARRAGWARACRCSCAQTTECCMGA